MAALINETIAKQVRDIFSMLENPVEILFFERKEGCEACAETRQLLEEVAALSDKIFLTARDIDDEPVVAEQYKIDKVPGFVIAAQIADQPVDYGVRYFGIPAGHEFTSLINDLVMVSRRDSGLSERTREFLKTLEKPVHLQVFVTPT